MRHPVRPSALHTAPYLKGATDKASHAPRVRRVLGKNLVGGLCRPDLAAVLNAWRRRAVDIPKIISGHGATGSEHPKQLAKLLNGSGELAPEMVRAIELAQ